MAWPRFPESGACFTDIPAACRLSTPLGPADYVFTIIGNCLQVMSSSDLTFGSNTALCGNICSALRNRKRDVTSIEEVPSRHVLKQHLSLPRAVTAAYTGHSHQAGSEPQDTFTPLAYPRPSQIHLEM